MPGWTPPILVTTGSGALRDTETNALQAGIDQVAVATPVTKRAHRIIATDQIPRLVAQAIRIALSGPRGPVLLVIPWDILMNQVEEDSIAIPEIDVCAQGPQPPDLTERALDSPAAALRPAIIVGSEVIRGCGHAALRAFVERTGRLGESRE